MHDRDTWHLARTGTRRGDVSGIRVTLPFSLSHSFGAAPQSDPTTTIIPKQLGSPTYRTSTFPFVARVGLCLRSDSSSSSMSWPHTVIGICTSYS